MHNEYSKKNVLVHKAWVFTCFPADVSAALLRFFPLSTFITEVEGSGWLNGDGVRAVQRHNKASRFWWQRETQTLALLHHDRLSPGTVPMLAFSPPSNSGFMFAYCASNSWFQPPCLSLCWAVGEGGEWWAGEAKNLSDFSFLPSRLNNTLISSYIQNPLVVFL